MVYPTPDNEAKRVEALHRYELLDTPAEQAFDDFTKLASYLCGTSVALISLIDSDRQWFKSMVGVDVCETPREQALCNHTILSNELTLVEDTSIDERFSENPLVASEPHVRFYAGVPLVDRDGFALGTLCVIDLVPRKLTTEQQDSLTALARQLMVQVELRRASKELADALAEINVLRGFLPICAHCKSIRNDEGYWSSVEQYISAHSRTRLSHGICPSCLKQHFPGMDDDQVGE